ncbi:hypothetical protein BGX34_004398 [Mortierella sp. NVP85]|nr:hypothetical protein BGX34_004398 [Mortierella sp. NVP85]
MKVLTLISGIVLATTTLLSQLTPTEAHMGIVYPKGQAGRWMGPKEMDPYVHAWLGYKKKKGICGGYKNGPVTTLKAGQIVKVRFWNFSIKDDVFPPKAHDKGGITQARHGGGFCEFSLSYDGGKNWWVIGQYTKSCPDIYYRWPVLIPPNVPSCTDSSKCLFSFSWLSRNVEQFYHHCANVKIIGGKKNGKLPQLRMKFLKSNDGKTADGDNVGKNKKSTGPDPKEEKLNRSGWFAYGGGAGKKGLDLGIND